MRLSKKYKRQETDMYENFANIYDRLQDIDYSSFVDYYEKIFSKYGLSPKLVLDLACGTGSVTIPMAKKGYDMIGVDLSEEMLHIASEKSRIAKTDILFLNQDMTEFELYGTVDAAICSLDGVNYLTEDGDLDKLFYLVHNYLNPGGIFIFDINSEHKLKNILGDNTFVYDEEDVFCVWDNNYDEDEKICSFSLDFFIKGKDGLYSRGEEYQEERAYSQKEICQIASKNSLEVIGIFNDRSFDSPTEQTERIFFVLKK